MPDMTPYVYEGELLELQKVLIRKWYEALRSKKYVQGESALRPEEETYCCLGVLCDIYNPSRWTKKVEGGGGFDCYFHYYWGDHADVPDDPAFSFLSLLAHINAEKWPNLHAPMGGALHVHNIFTQLNDDLGWDFESIAEVVKEMFPQAWEGEENVQVGEE